MSLMMFPKLKIIMQKRSLISQSLLKSKQYESVSTFKSFNLSDLPTKACGWRLTSILTALNIEYRH